MGVDRNERVTAGKRALGRFLGWSYEAGRSQGRPSLAVIFVIQVVQRSQVETINHLGSLANTAS